MHQRPARYTVHTPLLGTMCGAFTILMGVVQGWILMAAQRTAMAVVVAPGAPAPGPLGAAGPPGPAGLGASPSSIPWLTLLLAAMPALVGVLLIAFYAPAISPPRGGAVEHPRLSAYARARLRGMLGRRAYRRLNGALLRTAAGRYRAIGLAGIGAFILIGVDQRFSMLLASDTRIVALFGLQMVMILLGFAVARRVAVAADPFLRRRFPGHCPRCAYPAGPARPSACPECGQAMGGPRPDRPPRRRSCRRR